ncbi:MAG: LysM domain-containing protein, partial [Sulfurospirillaceae bacterium]
MKIAVGSEEYIVFDGNITSDEIAFSAFSGYMALSGETARQVLAQYGEDIAKFGIKTNWVFAVSDGVITGIFDANMNPDKELTQIITERIIEIGTGYLGSLAGAWAGGKIGALIGTSFTPAGTAIGAVAGAVVGSVVGSLNSDDWYENSEKLFCNLAENIDQEFSFMSTEITGTVTPEEFLIEYHGKDKFFPLKVYPEYQRYRQIVTIVSNDTPMGLKEILSIDSVSKTANIEIFENSDKEIEKEYVETILKETTVEKLSLNSQTYNIVKEDNLIVRNAIEHIPTVSFLLSNILIRTNEILDVGEHGLYKVNSDDTMSEIAQRFGFTTQQLLKYNTWLID